MLAGVVGPKLYRETAIKKTKISKQMPLFSIFILEAKIFTPFTPEFEGSSKNVGGIDHRSNYQLLLTAVLLVS